MEYIENKNKMINSYPNISGIILSVHEWNIWVMRQACHSGLKNKIYIYYFPEIHTTHKNTAILKVWKKTNHDKRKLYSCLNSS